MKIELQDILNATGLGFGYLLSSLVASLLNAAQEPTNPQHALTAMNTCHKLAQFADRPHSPMPFQVIASLIQSLGPAPGEGEPRYAALILKIWARNWNPTQLAQEIGQIGVE